MDYGNKHHRYTYSGFDVDGYGLDNTAEDGKNSEAGIILA
jgi:hypothetical protein